MANARQFMASRTAEWSKALPYLRRVAYLESHGTEFIDTGIVPTSDYGFEVELVKLHNDETVPIGTWSDWTDRMWGSDFKYQNSSFLSVHGKSWNENRYRVINIKLVERLHHGMVTVEKNGVIDISRQYDDSFVCDKTAYLFANNVNYSIRHAGAIKIYGANITDENDRLVRDFIPVLDLSGRPAMYDDVSGNLFYNQGTGEFTWGEL